MKIYKYPTFIILLILVIICCYLLVDHFKEKKELNESLKTASILDYYRKQVIEKGDIKSYSELQFEYDNSDNFLFVALIMSNKYNYQEAYYDVFYCLTRYSNKNKLEALDDMDQTTKTMALDYLKQGALKGNPDCKQILGKFYIQGKYLGKDIQKGNKLLLEAN